MQRRTLMIAGVALTSVAFMPAALAADGLPYDAKGDPFAFVVDLSNWSMRSFCRQPTSP